VCTSADPRDRRFRTGAIVETDATRILIDAPPELRIQLLTARISAVDALLLTHDHADHTHGIDDVRALTVRRKAALPVYGPPETIASVAGRFPYAFDPSVKPLPGTSKPELDARPVEAGDRIAIGDIVVETLELPHGPMRVFGYRFGPVAYVTDAKSVSPEVVERLRGVSVLVLNALRHQPHPTHMSIADAVETARRVGAGRTYFTHLTHEQSHAALAAELPPGIEPAYDGLVVETP
jgi:phosphoribosyl 1,2-cyclic phosphate phosphodiesterase